MIEKEKIEYKLLYLKTEQFAIFEEVLPTEEEPSVAIDLELDFGINEENKQFMVITSFTFSEEQKIFLKIALSCHLSIHPDSWIKLKEDTKIIIPKHLVEQITELCVGAVRGALHVKTEGTPFNQYVLPPIDVHQLTEEDIVFNQV